MLMLAAILLVICGTVHSIMGERYILRRLFKRDNLPHLSWLVFFAMSALSVGSLLVR